MNEETAGKFGRLRAISVDMIVAADARDADRVLDVAVELELLIHSIRLEERANEELSTPASGDDAETQRRNRRRELWAE